MLRSIVQLTPHIKKGVNSVNLRPLSSTQSPSSPPDPSKNSIPRVVPEQLNTTEFVVGGLLNLVASPLHLLGSGLITCPARHIAVGTYFGKYTGQHFSEGLSWVWHPWGFDVQKVFIGDSSMKLENSKIIDKVGNPVVVSGIINYNVVRPERYLLGIDNPSQYIYNQADAILKKVVSQYSYDDLRASNSSIREELQERSQEVLDVVGVQVSAFNLTDMNYAKEIAQSMLVKQQAMAYTDAKKHITEASTEIIGEILKKYEDILDDKAKADLIKNLLVVITSGSSVQPTLPMN